MKLSQRSSEGVIIRQPPYFTKDHLFSLSKQLRNYASNVCLAVLFTPVMRMIVN
jgi:hypothetical protein